MHCSLDSSPTRPHGLAESPNRTDRTQHVVTVRWKIHGPNRVTDRTGPIGPLHLGRSTGNQRLRSHALSDWSEQPKSSRPLVPDRAVRIQSYRARHCANQFNRPRHFLCFADLRTPRRLGLSSSSERRRPHARLRRCSAWDTRPLLSRRGLVAMPRHPTSKLPHLHL